MDEAPDRCSMDHGGVVGSAECPATGDPLPSQPIDNPECDDKEPGATRWLGAEPHTPLAIVDAGGVRSATDACCAPWARRGERWRAIDAWGQVVGEAEVTGGEGYDVSHCYELSLGARSGRLGVGLFASVRGTFRSPPTAAWAAGPAERSSFARFVADVERLSVDSPQSTTALPGLEQRTLFFRVASSDGRSRRLVPHAVAGGRILIVAYLAPDGRWVLAHVENELSDASPPPNAYQPLAVFDVDGDAVPEIFFHATEGASWGDWMLRRTTERFWEAVAESVGGGTA